MIHKLKILPAYFEQVKRGIKKFEIRDNSDRGFQAGDICILQEWRTEVVRWDAYTGNEIQVEITYVSNYNQPANQVVFGFNLVEEKQ